MMKGHPFKIKNMPQTGFIRAHLQNTIVLYFFVRSDVSD